jgi:hypothetical protein
MARLQFSLVAAIAAVAACSAGAPAQAQSSPAATPALSTDVPVYQGGVFVTAVTSACTANNIAVGNYWTMDFRQLPRPVNTAHFGGGFEFVSDRSSLSYVMPPGTPLNGGHTVQTSVTAYGESGEAGPYNYTGAFNLTISPATLNATTPSAVVTITGTVADLWDYTGCTVTIRAALALRP